MKKILLITALVLASLQLTAANVDMATAPISPAFPDEPAH